MSKKRFTDEQRSAIETRDKTLLVSAAAGSGKTATLTERIIRSITDGENPESINRMLIVTFTNAAVGELRDRISKAIKQKLAEEPKNSRLEHQLYLLPSAKICTIDAFCNDILKNNAERFGISPRYRIADPIEAQILEHSVLSALIDAAYGGELEEITPRDFEELSSSLTGVKNDSALEEVLMSLYERSKSLEEGVGIYRKFAERLGEYSKLPVEKNPYGDYAMRCAKECAGHYIGVIDTLCEGLYVIGDEKYSARLAEDGDALRQVQRADTYEDMRIALSYKLANLPPLRDKTDMHILAADARADMKEAIFKKCADRYFTYSTEEWHSHTDNLSRALSVLATFIERFDEVYFEEKKRRSLLEYSDIERLTYLCLYGEDGKPSELALAEREEYSSVYIDEYQDVNALQNKIFEALSRSNNCFTVGDIKQSIYGFRSARPDIFANMKKSYPQLSEAGNSDKASIFMSKNFRCDKGIIDFVNAIFDEMFPLVSESIGYVREDRLEFAKIYDDCPTPPLRNPEIMLFARGEDTEDEEEGAGLTRGELSPKWVAEKIKFLTENERLNSGEPVRPSDIAIILRKDMGRAELYANELKSLGIAARVPENKNFFLNAEIQLTLCLLNVINNPRKDIYLAGLMLSPLYGFTPDELYLARREGGRSLWESIALYAEKHPNKENFSAFISSIRRYREVSEGMRADELISRLYKETGLLALASRDGSKENLMLLYDYAHRFEASSFEGLYSFINYVNTVIESGASFSAKSDGEESSAVTITTIHKSKGLEYPVVFLADAEASLVSSNERKARVAYSDDFGMAMRMRIPGGLARVESPIYNAIIDYNVEKNLEEALRVYYVGLTRARERLYIVGAPRADTRADYEKKARVRALSLTPYSLKQMKSFVDILYSVNTNATVCWQDSASQEELSCEEAMPIDEGAPVSNTAISDDSLYDLLTQRFSYEYPSAHLSLLPEKMSISKLYPTVLDETDGEIQLSLDGKAEDESSRGILPEFIVGSSEYESARRGIATHNFLQFFDIDSFMRLGASGELSRLTEEGFISKDNARRVRLPEIERFADSALYRDMRAAKKLYREFRFSVMLPAHLFTADEERRAALINEKILAQGVIDCIIEDERGLLHLIDYKTDRLTKEELADKSLAAKTLSEKHSLQLSYYARAIEKIFGRAPSTVRIYSLPLGDTVDIDID